MRIRPDIIEILELSKEIISNFEIIPALIILVREIAVSGLREFLAGIKVSVPASKIAKFKTFLQLIALGILILSEGGISVIPILMFGKIALCEFRNNIFCFWARNSDYRYSGNSRTR